MRIIYNVRHCYAIRLKFGDKFLNILILTFSARMKTSICSKVKENLLLYYRKFSAFVVIVTI